MTAFEPLLNWEVSWPVFAIAKKSIRSYIRRLISGNLLTCKY